MSEDRTSTGSACLIAGTALTAPRSGPYLVDPGISCLQFLYRHFYDPMGRDCILLLVQRPFSSHPPYRDAGEIRAALA